MMSVSERRLDAWDAIHETDEDALDQMDWETGLEEVPGIAGLLQQEMHWSPGVWRRWCEVGD